MTEDWSYNKYYYEKNKKHLKEKVECGCGSKVARYNLQHHRKTKKHKAWENDETQQEIQRLKDELKCLKQE